MEKILSSTRVPIGRTPPVSFSSSSSIYQISFPLGFRTNGSSSRLFGPLRVSLSNSEGVATKEWVYSHDEELVDLESFGSVAFGWPICAESQGFEPILQRISVNSLPCYGGGQWLLELSQIPEITEVPSFSENAKSYLEDIISNFSKDDALEVKIFEKVTNHDVKAVEYFLKQRCQYNTEITEVLEFFHFACTSEDINNLAHALALKGAFNTVIFLVMIELVKAYPTRQRKILIYPCCLAPVDRNTVTGEVC